ncbi:MAG TPA: hypothetical protein VNG35_17125 [Gemmatimonadales bacterium]|nr:hypothetical protein [Gemmatimonadales bacterium]
MPALNDAILLVPSAATAASGNLVVPGKGLGRYRACVLLLDVTAAATLAGDTLNVYVQKNVGPPGGTAVWSDMASFTQVLGNGGAKQFRCGLATSGVAVPAMAAVGAAALAAGSVSSGEAWSSDWRVQWVVAGTGTFTWSLTGHFQD